MVNKVAACLWFVSCPFPVEGPAAFAIDVPDVSDPGTLLASFTAVTELNVHGVIGFPLSFPNFA